ncbi:uncharacterized protein PHACADRAFT_254170 [Phanerochaete carnosa HHB-10118-sp]|uniref:COP9 signalosome complex subunit 3 n=1 Tax=Phanerochaete carnosa (strain HHB-10118-sp) TaxID=650164 RepID=K5V2S6_PHACS|nr:uncharacterized protein PHACADRAFT_254170 [Phanerochaete carnosa HHB-10118-sp]EKM56836.1 hypothetical protein PHACADRAFT_254170 [Phanerochaete carnosa HHB-10118-sp]
MAPSTSTAAQPGPSAALAPAQEQPKTLDELVQYLTTTTGSAATVNGTLKTFGTKETRDTLLASTLGSGQDPLEVLSPETNTLGYLYILAARLDVSGALPPQIQHVESFCKRFTPEHARLAPDRISALAKGIVKASGENIKHALDPLCSIVLRYPPKPTYLTSVHPIFLHACVTARHFAAALPVLSTPIVDIDTTISDLHYNDNLLYHYAGGVVFAVLKRWREAEEFFEIVVTSPAQTPAAIQFEALKKLTLVQLILYGKAIQPPKYTNNQLIRMIKNSPYNTLGKAYPQTAASLTAIVQKDVEAFRSDQNLGLVQQVIDRASRWLIKKLTLTYITLGLTDIGKEVGVEAEEVRVIVLNMIEIGDINASISIDGNVTFADSTPQFTKADVDAALARAQEQSKLLRDVERALNSSKDYLQKALKHKDDAWGMDEDMYSTPPSGAWAEESMYA